MERSPNGNGNGMHENNLGSTAIIELEVAEPSIEQELAIYYQYRKQGGEPLAGYEDLIAQQEAQADSDEQ